MKSFTLYSMGFVPNTTTHALINITEKIRSALDHNKVLCGIFIDLQKAFDTVNHKILLQKLNYCGYRGVINDWFRSYLFERKQKVCIKTVLNLKQKLCIMGFLRAVC